MSARDEILDKVRAALASAPAAPVVRRGYRQVVTPESLLDLFAARVTDYRAVVVRCSRTEVEAEIADALAGAVAVVPPELPWAVPDSVVDSGQSATELDAVEAVVTGARVGIARTGTIVLDHGAGQGRRAISLVPDLHVCVVLAEQVVPGVPEAMALLDPTRPQTWISGPSATSDIELDRVEGVHGPRTLRVIVVE